MDFDVYTHGWKNERRIRFYLIAYKHNRNQICDS